MSTNAKITCCLCGKEITDTWGRHNPDPLVAPDENGFLGDCCSECNARYVKPVRQIFWAPHPHLSFRERKKLDSLALYVQQMPLSDLRKALDSEDPLAAFQRYRKAAETPKQT